MAVRVSSTEFRLKFGETLDTALAEPVLVEKHGRPSHVLISAKAFEKMKQRLMDAGIKIEELETVQA